MTHAYKQPAIRQDQARAVVQRYPSGVTAGVVAECMGVSNRVASRVLRALADKGQIQRLRWGLYAPVAPSLRIAPDPTDDPVLVDLQQRLQVALGERDEARDERDTYRTALAGLVAVYAREVTRG